MQISLNTTFCELGLIEFETASQLTRVFLQLPRRSSLGHRCLTVGRARSPRRFRLLAIRYQERR